jgi:hypothetical protein
MANAPSQLMTKLNVRVGRRFRATDQAGPIVNRSKSGSTQPHRLGRYLRPEPAARRRSVAAALPTPLDATNAMREGRTEAGHVARDDALIVARINQDQVACTKGKEVRHKRAGQITVRIDHRATRMR